MYLGTVLAFGILLKNRKMVQQLFEFLAQKNKLNLGELFKVFILAK